MTATTKTWQVKDITEESIIAAATPDSTGSLARLATMYPDCPFKVVLRAVQHSKITEWGVSENHYWVVDPETGYQRTGLVSDHYVV